MTAARPSTSPLVLYPSAELAKFASQLQYSDIPEAVSLRCEDLFLDTMASILAGSGARAVKAMAKYAERMGPADGKSEDFVNRRKTSPVFAAMVNAAASHVVEQDDVHNGSVFHPAAVIFPPALAVAQAIGASGKDFITASVVGYEVGIRVHTTGTAGTVAAAVTVGHLLKLNPEQMLHAIGSAGTQAAGLWEFLRDAADSKQLHTAHAAANGLASAYLALDGFTGARRILEGAQGMAAGMSTDADPAKLVDRLGSRWALPETSFKFHASCRHTHPAADALQQAMKQHGLKASDIASVVTHVHQGAIDVLGPVTDPQTVHQSKFSMGTVLALIALRNSADLAGFDGALKDAAVANFRDRVSMVLDEEVDTAYPQRWIGKVTVKTTDGRSVTGRVDEPKGDPGNTLSRDEIEFKAMRLGTYEGAATEAQVKALIKTVWGIRGQNVLGDILARP